MKYVCTICGYTYDPAVGDAERGIAPGTPWEQVDDDWNCPICGADKSAFEEA
jgi:rubredoxin